MRFYTYNAAGNLITQAALDSVTAGRLLETHPERVVERAVQGMLPKTRLGRKLFSKLRVYGGADHPHAAQKPEPLELNS